MEKIFKIFKAEIKKVDNEKFTVEAIVSTKKQDRDGDVILPSAFERRLKVYKEHPILLSSHNYQDLRKQIGEAIGISVTEKGLEATFKYYAGLGNTEADWAWVLAQKGIASFSVGFIGHESEIMQEKDESGNMRYVGRKFTDVELLEISQVLVPSNRGALQMSVERAKEEIEICEMVGKSFDGDVFFKAEEKKVEEKKVENKKEEKVEKVEDKAFQWVCSKCGNVFAKGIDEMELVCLCGTKCDLEAKHYSEIIAEQGKNISIPVLNADEIVEVLQKTIQKIFNKGE